MNIIPKPQKYTEINKTFALTEGKTIYSDPFSCKGAEHFAEIVSEETGIKLAFTDVPENADIFFTRTKEYPDGGYGITCNETSLEITSSDDTGAFYAAETLRQLFALDFSKDGETPVCANCHLVDCPKYMYRGLHFDIARHFFKKEEIMRIIELMSRVKLNKLHLHISDDQGFRVEIEKYPRLNEISSWRNGSERRENGKIWVDEERYGGYLTKADVKEIVDYAKSKYIDVIPELDLPGHFVSVLSAYPEYSCVGGELEVRKKWGISKDILCAGNEETFDFVCGILDEIIEMFPSPYIHLGGDESPKDRWCNCKKCQDKMRELNITDPDEFQVYLFNRFVSYLAKKGKRVIGWNDGFTSATDESVICQHWLPLSAKRTAKIVAEGHDVVMSPFFRMYFDYPYAMTPLRRTYMFNPELRHISKKDRKHIIGVEGALWTEFVGNTDKLYFCLLPRLLALAECAWGTNGNYSAFKKRARHYCKLYDKMGLTRNKSAFSPRLPLVGLCGVKRFFKKDAYWELVKQQTKDLKRTEKKSK